MESVQRRSDYCCPEGIGGRGKYQRTVHGIALARFQWWKSKSGGLKPVLVMQVEVALSQRRACGLMELHRGDVPLSHAEA
jgi:hypothetical protein